MQRRLLITGASGTLGRELTRQALKAGWDVTGTYRSRRLDLPIDWQLLRSDATTTADYGRQRHTWPRAYPAGFEGRLGRDGDLPFASTRPADRLAVAPI